MAMRAAVVGDSHYDQHKRFGECVRLHAWIREDAERRGCNLTVHTGDLFERKSTPLEREAAFGWAQDMADLGEYVQIRGNHDFLGDLLLMMRLDSRHPITVVEGAAVVEVGGALIACMAWPRKSELLAATGAEGRADAEAIAVEALRDQLRGLGDELAAHDGPTMLAMHAMVRDSRAGTGQPLVGCDFEIGLEDLALVRAQAYFLGHIHLHQSWLIGDAPVIYPGDPRRTDFGEGRDPKGYVVATWDDAGKLVGWEFVEAPATPMALLEATWSEADDELKGSWTFEQLNGTRGAEVRLRYTTRSDRREASRKQAERWRDELLADGALLVQLEERVSVEQRTRAEAIPVNATLEQKVVAYWAAKSFEPGERRDALLGKVRHLREARRAA